MYKLKMVFGVALPRLRFSLFKVLQRANRKSTISVDHRSLYILSGKMDIPSFTENKISVVSKANRRFLGTLPGDMEETKLLSKEECQKFDAVFPNLVQDIIRSPELGDMPETNRWMSKVLDYNVPRGKRNRGLDTVLAYKYLSKDLTPENTHLSFVLGWCVEILQAFILVADDIMDEFETRRGQLCWHRTGNVGLAGFNDALFLESSVYSLLKKYFCEKDYYTHLLNILHDTTFKTTYGEILDLRTGLDRRFETYTLDTYSAIVKYKASYYSFCLPVSLAMAMTGLNDPEFRKQAEEVTLEMGRFFQIQDDYLDCFGNEEVTGKIGTDIQAGKCSWLIVTALQKASTEQRHVLLDNFGKNDPENIRAVKKLYTELEIAEQYLSFEEQSYASICTQIQQMSPALPKNLFHGMLTKIYRRKS